MNAIEKNMAEPVNFVSKCGVLTVCMAITCTLYITFGIQGYIRYGPDYCYYFISTGSLIAKLPLSEW